MDRFMDDRERTRCEDWIRKYLTGYSRKQADSYVLKHMFQRMTGIYASDAEFQTCMQNCGFEPMPDAPSVFNAKIDNVVIQRVYCGNEENHRKTKRKWG